MDLRQRIRQDARLLAGDPEASALLECLTENLFGPDLDNHFLARTCGASRGAHRRLAARVGPLKGYITELRMIEAARLVRETKLTNAEMARRLGYRVTKTFRRAFKSHFQVTPGAMRRQGAVEPSSPPDPVAAAENALDQLATDERRTPWAEASRQRRQASIAGIDARQAADLRRQLHRRHPGLEQEAEAPGDPETQPMPLILLPTGDHLEKFAAISVFERIAELQEADLRHAMLDGVRIGSSHNVEAFQEVCSHRAPYTPERAVAMAELGVQLIELQRPSMGDVTDDCKVQAWAFLGYVNMKVGDFAAAERAVGFAREELPRDRPPAPWAEIELCRMEGLLSMHQARATEAATAMDRAVDLGRELDPLTPARLCALTERLELASLLGDAEAGLRLTGEIEELVQVHGAGDDRPDLWPGYLAYHRGKARAAAGRDDLAGELWQQAGKDLAPGSGGAAAFDVATLNAFVTHEMARLAGRLQNLDVYDALLRDTIARHQKTRTPLLEASVEAELSALCALRGEADEARQLATSAASFFEDLPAHRRAWSTASRLRALANGGAEAPASELESMLQAFRLELDLLRWEITGAQAMSAGEAREARA